ncbi:hypothetical protein [uncultured Kordia sp.]|uniref:hypothetical protein n=1 Tax=uncultured Kordia sp. TaxID=507699 RepID=UPI0026112E5B|nr:hypothetical protein [uncultured Kordia sp.]
MAKIEKAKFKIDPKTILKRPDWWRQFRGIRAVWADTPITLDEEITDDVWSGAHEAQRKFGEVYMMAKNDAKYLYVILDVVTDTHNDPGTGDYFSFSFDVNRNRAITPNKDIDYSCFRERPNTMGRQYYIRAGAQTGMMAEERSECRTSFGTSPNSDTPHRIWKLKFRISDISKSVLPWITPSSARFGFSIGSTRPRIRRHTPDNYLYDFSNLHTVYFSKKPQIPVADLGPVIGNVGYIPTTKINATTGRATTDAGYILDIENAAFAGIPDVVGNSERMEALTRSGAKKYKIYHKFGAGSFAEFETSWRNYKWNGFDYVLENFGPDGSNFYKMPNQNVDYIIDDLLFQFDSRNLQTGLHSFKVKFFNNAGVEVPTGTAEQVVKMYIDNNVPEVSIKSIKYNNVEIGACGIVNLQQPTDELDIEFEAYDKEGNLENYSLAARWGNNQSKRIVKKVYGSAGASGNWKGSRTITASFNPQTTCAHSFNVVAYSRATNGRKFVGRNTAYRYLTIIK